MTRRRLLTDVLVIGGGFAGVNCARQLERRLPKGSEVTLLSSSNHFVFQPLLPEVVGASLQPAHVSSPLRHMLRRTRILRGEVRRVDLAEAGGAMAGSVLAAVDDGDAVVEVSARHIVLALGSVTDPSLVPGMAEHALQMKTVDDAVLLRQRIVARLEGAVTESDPARRAAMLTFVVVGGGFSGVETAAEIHDLVRAASAYYPSLRDVDKRVVVVHASDRLLPELPEKLGNHSLETLRKRGVAFEMGVRTRAISREAVHLSDGRKIPTMTAVCTIGNGTHPVVRSLAGPDQRRLDTDSCLRVAGYDRVWAIGDCARSPDGHGGICPPTAQFAARQGAIAAHNIRASIEGKALRVFRHKSLGQLATLGHRRAVAAIGPLRFTGFFAWWLWRTIYLGKLPRFERKLRVVLDWTLSLFFPRDLSALQEDAGSAPRAIHLEEGDVLFRQGDPSHAFFVIETGRVRLTRTNTEGVELGCDLLGPGEHFGEGSLLHGSERTTTAVASVPTTVLAFRAEPFLSLTQNFAGLQNLLEATSRRFRFDDDLMPRWLPADRLDRTLGEFMTRDAITARHDMTLGEAMRTMFDMGINSLPLVDDAAHVLGVFTSTDAFAALRRNVDLDLPLGPLATSRVHTLQQQCTVREAVALMRRYDVKHVVVTDGDQRLAGVVSIKDLLRGAVDGGAADGDGEATGPVRPPEDVPASV